MSAVSAPIWAGDWSKSIMSAWVVNAEKLRAKADTRSSGGSPLPPAASQARRPGSCTPGFGTRAGGWPPRPAPRRRRGSGRGCPRTPRPRISAFLVWIVRPGPRSSRRGRPWARQALDRAAATGLEHVLHRGQDQLVVAGVVAEDGAGAHAGHSGDLVDGGVESPPGDDLHGGSPDASTGEVSLLLSQRGGDGPCALSTIIRSRRLTAVSDRATRSEPMTSPGSDLPGSIIEKRRTGR